MCKATFVPTGGVAYVEVWTGDKGFEHPLASDLDTQPVTT
jgi:hypothetical protein